MTQTNNIPGSASAPTPPDASSGSAAASGSAPTAKRWTRFITPTLALLATLIIGFFGGLLVGQNSSNQASPGGNGFPGSSQDGEMPSGGAPTGEMPDGGPDGMPGEFTSGTVASIDGDTITLELSDGSTVTITTGAATSVTVTEESSVEALAEGDTITVIGEADDDGNVTATTITEGATGFGGMGARPSD